MDIIFERDKNRAAAYSGDTLAGECDVVMLPAFWIITHTKVGDDFGGQGIAGKLVDCVMQAAKEADVRVKPFCSYAAKRIGKTPEYTEMKDTSVITVYGMPTCPHCAYVHEQIKDSADFKFVDIGAHVMNMKRFIRLRDTERAFDRPKSEGGIGIPCFVTEDGTVTLIPEEVGLVSKSAADAAAKASKASDNTAASQDGGQPAAGAACRIDGSGC